MRERVHRRWRFDSHRFMIIGHAGRYALLANPRLDHPYVVIDLDDGATEGMFAELTQAFDELDKLAKGGE